MFPEQRYGSVHLHCLRHPIHAEQCRAAAMRNLRRRAAVRSTTRTNLDHNAALTAGHFNSYRQYEPGVIGIGTQPQFAIGQRALVVSTPNGNVLWDCISMLDPATTALINGLGSLKAIAISHPHFYTTMVEWSRAFGGIPIHLHADDHRWIMSPDPA